MCDGLLCLHFTGFGLGTFDEALDQNVENGSEKQPEERHAQHAEEHRRTQSLPHLRAGADTFGPIGPVIASGIDHANLYIMTRLNGKIMQDENTSHMVHGCEKIVSFISQATTLFPGDLIFTGTGGATSAMKPGDTVEIEIEGIGILRNKIV